jgi:hypothetical protein
MEPCVVGALLRQLMGGQPPTTLVAADAMDKEEEENRWGEVDL